jgi:hypothetical protein
MPKTTRKPRVVSFACSRKDSALVAMIVRRAMASKLNLHVPGDADDLEMDLLATHANGCPLDFEKLLAFNEFNFAHDVVGIQRHLDRDTGELLHCFVPRCAKPA